MSLLQLYLMITDCQQTTVKAMAEFNALIYGSYFLQSPLAYAAVYQIQNPAGPELKIAQAAKKSVCRHLWYLTQELVVLALFDKKLPECERYEMACKLNVKQHVLRYKIWASQHSLQELHWTTSCPAWISS